MRKLTSRTARSLIGTAVFLGIGVFLYLMACRFLKYPDGVNWATGTGMADVRAHKNQYDVVFVGTSTSIANVSCQELYQSFGIAAVCVGEPEQPVFLSKYTLKDMFRSQKPQVVVLDSKAFFYTEAHDIAVEEGEEEFIYHRSIDAISSTAIKKEALETIRKMYPDRFGEIDLWEYYSVMYRSHANWETLDYRNFHGHDLTDCMNGNIALAAVETGRTDEYAASDPEEEEEIDAEIVSQVTEIAQLCEENGAELVITSGYNVFTKARHRAVAELAGQLGVPYLDVNEVIDELDPFPDSFMLEVSSPGLARPLRKAHDFERFAGETIQLTTTASEGRRKFTGELKGLEEGNVVVTCDGEDVRIPLDEVKSCKIKPNYDA